MVKVKVIYDKTTNIVISILPDDQDPLIYYQHYGKEFIDKIGFIFIDRVPRFYKKSMIVDGEIVPIEEYEWKYLGGLNES